MKIHNILKYILIPLLILGSNSVDAKLALSAKSKAVSIDEHQIQVTTWGDISSTSLPWVVMISGPIDSWHSDSAWFATLAPILASQYRVMALDRAGQIYGTENAPVGYQRFAIDLHQVLNKYHIENGTLIAFASSNISAQLYFNQYQNQQAINSVLLIDPDVLTPFSIGRYSSDAKPFKENLEQYLAYISEGKYTARVEQKNAADMVILKGLSKTESTDWEFVDRIFKSRLLVNNQLNQFREVARYDEDLQAAANVNWPADIPTVIIDTQFEKKYIDNTEDPEAKAGLVAWQKDAKSYYQSMAKMNSRNAYREVSTQAHLFQVEQPLVVAEMIKELRSK